MLRANARLSFVLFLPISLLVATCGWNDDDEDSCGGDLSIAAASNHPLALPDEPALITVVAVNHGESRVVWGHGSSSCQLRAVVRDGEREYRVLENRPCTDDISEQGLDPGEVRMEVLPWDGMVLGNAEAFMLPPGRYRVHGVAGSWISPLAVEIEIRRQ